MFLLIPYKQLTIKTPLSMQKAEERLAENVGKIRWRWSTSNAPFNGTVENGRFNIIRATNYRHTFQPAIIGQFHGAQDMTRIEINMRLYSQAILLLGFFLSMLVYNGISLFRFPNLVSIPGLPFSQMTSVGGMALVLYLLTMIPFNYEVHRAQQELEKMFSSSNMMGDEG